MPLVENRTSHSFITQHVDSYPCFALVLVENNFATTYTQKKQPFAAGVLCLRRKWVNSCGFPTRAEKSLQAYSHHGILTLKEFYSYVKWMLYPWKKSPISIGSLWESKRYPINPILISWMYVFWSFRSFQRGTLGVCKSTGFKVTSCQSWRMILSSRNRTWAALMWFEVGRVAGFFSDPQLWQLVVLQPFDIERLTIPLLKDPNLLSWHIAWFPARCWAWSQ